MLKIVATDWNDHSKNDGKEEYCRNMGTLREPLRVIDHLKWVPVAHGVDDKLCMHTVLGLEEAICLQKMLKTDNIGIDGASNIAGEQNTNIINVQ